MPARRDAASRRGGDVRVPVVSFISLIPASLDTTQFPRSRTGYFRFLDNCASAAPGFLILDLLGFPLPRYAATPLYLVLSVT